MYCFYILIEALSILSYIMAGVGGNADGRKWIKIISLTVYHKNLCYLELFIFYKMNLVFSHLMRS